MQADPALYTSLDGLRAGDAGDLLPRDSVSAAQLITNDFLPPPPAATTAA